MKKIFAVFFAFILCFLGCITGCSEAPTGNVVAVSILETPIKLVYYPGEKLKVRGATIKLTTEDGQVLEKKLKENDCEANLSSPGKKTVKVNAYGKITEFSVYVATKRLSKSKDVNEEIRKASDGDVLWLAQGTYNEQITVDGKKLTIIGDGRGSLFIGPDKYEELGFENGETGIFILKNGAELEMQNITLCLNPKSARQAKLSQEAIPALLLLDSSVTLKDCKIKGFSVGNEILRRGECKVTAGNLKIKG